MPTPSELRNSIDRVAQVLHDHAKEDREQFAHVNEQLTAIRDAGHETNITLAKGLVVADQVAAVHQEVESIKAELRSLNEFRSSNKWWMKLLEEAIRITIVGAIVAGIATLAAVYYGK